MKHLFLQRFYKAVNKLLLFNRSFVSNGSTSLTCYENRYNAKNIHERLGGRGGGRERGRVSEREKERH